MLAGNIGDLDNLPSKCYTRSGRAFLVETIQCYRVGSFRAATLSIWQAIVFDYIEKLEELALSDDKQALAKISDFKKHSSAGYFPKVLEFERELLKDLRETFQFISQNEEIDLLRIKEDRNRCSHSSFNFDEEPYSPTAEQVRSHIIAAFNTVLSQPPTYGKAALESIIEYFESPNFPEEDDVALSRLKKSPLGSARYSLISNLLKVLVKNVIVPARQTSFFWAHKVTLILKIQRENTLCSLGEDFEKIYSKALIDGNFKKMLNVVNIEPELFNTFSSHHQDELINCLKAEILADRIRSITTNFEKLSTVPEILACIEQYANYYDYDFLEKLFIQTKNSSYLDVLVDKYARVTNFSTAGDYGRAVIKLNKHLSIANIDSVFSAFQNNRQIRNYMNGRDVLDSLLSSKILKPEEFKKYVDTYSLSDIFTDERIEVLSTK